MKSKKEIFKKIFKDFISGIINNNDINELIENIDINDIEFLVNEINKLNDPSDYFSGSEKRDQNAIKGFFLIIDLVSAIIIHTNNINILDKTKYNGRYTEWLFKYISDKRFDEEILNKFNL